MPELPEAERNRTLCESNLVGKRLLQVIFTDKNGKPETIAHGNVIHPSEHQKWKCLEGRTLVSVHRLAKVMYWKFDQGKSPLFTFGMSGSLHLQGSTALDYKNFTITEDIFPPKHSRIIFEFENNINISCRYYFMKKTIPNSELNIHV